MYIIQIEPYEGGARSPLQTWDGPNLPDGYAFCPDEFFDVFYSTNPAGFVNITVETVEVSEGMTAEVVTAMEVNWGAYNAYIAEHPVEPEPEPDPVAPTDDSAVWDALDKAYQEGVDSV